MRYYSKHLHHVGRSGFLSLQDYETPAVYKIFVFIDSTKQMTSVCSQNSLNVSDIVFLMIDSEYTSNVIIPLLFIETTWI